MNIGILLFDANDMAASAPQWLHTRTLSERLSSSKPVSSDDRFIMAVYSQKGFGIPIPCITYDELHDDQSWAAAVADQGASMNHYEGSSSASLTTAILNACAITGARAGWLAPMGFDLSKYPDLSGKLHAELPRNSGLSFTVFPHDLLAAPVPVKSQQESPATQKTATVPPAQTPVSAGGMATRLSADPGTSSAATSTVRNTAKNTAKTSTATAVTERRRRTWFDVIPPVLSCMSLLVLAWCMLIRNMPELDLGAQPSILNVPIKALANHGLADTIGLLVFLIPCIVGLPGSPLVRTVIIIVSDTIYMFVPASVAYSTVGEIALVIITEGWAFLIFIYFDWFVEFVDEFTINRLTSAKKVFITALASGLAICAVAPLSMAITRMGRPFSDFAGYQKSSSGKGDAIRMLFTTTEWWSSCAFVMIYALWAACLFAACLGTGFWGHKVSGTFLGLVFGPILVAVLAWVFGSSVRSCLGLVDCVALMTAITVTADDHKYEERMNQERMRLYS